MICPRYELRRTRRSIAVLRLTEDGSYYERCLGAELRHSPPGKHGWPWLFALRVDLWWFCLQVELGEDSSVLKPEHGAALRLRWQRHGT